MRPGVVRAALMGASAAFLGGAIVGLGVARTSVQPGAPPPAFALFSDPLMFLWLFLAGAFALAAAWVHEPAPTPRKVRLLGMTGGTGLVLALVPILRGLAESSVGPVHLDLLLRLGGTWTSPDGATVVTMPLPAALLLWTLLLASPACLVLGFRLAGRSAHP